MDIDYSILPEHMQSAMHRYIENGEPVGDFLTAVLSNDLMEALGRADDINSRRLRDYGYFLYNYAPLSCYGSRQAVKRWQKRGGLKGEADVPYPDFCRHPEKCRGKAACPREFACND